MSGRMRDPTLSRPAAFLPDAVAGTRTTASAIMATWLRLPPGDPAISLTSRIAIDR